MENAWRHAILLSKLCLFGVATRFIRYFVRNETQRPSRAKVYSAMTIRDPETLRSSSTSPAFNGASIWRMILKSSSSLVLLVICSICIVRLIWQECTKRQMEQLFKATEKTFILGCGLL